MKNLNQKKSKLIQFEKYDTVRIMTLDTMFNPIVHKGLFLSCGDCFYRGNNEEYTEMRMIVGSQRGTGQSIRIAAYLGVRIYPVRMVLVEKMKKEVKKI